MVLLFFTEVILETSWWALKKTYDAGYYLIYGTEETNESKILRQLRELKKQNEEGRQQLFTLQKDLEQLYMATYRGLPAPAAQKNYINSVKIEEVDEMEEALEMEEMEEIGEVEEVAKVAETNSKYLELYRIMAAKKN